jgi:hypothetical protein
MLFVGRESLAAMLTDFPPGFPGDGKSSLYAWIFAAQAGAAATAGRYGLAGAQVAVICALNMSND